MKLLGIALLVTTSSAFASSNAYDLKMDLSINGKHVSSPRVIVKEGEPATIAQKTGAEEQFIEVVATEGSVHSHKGILMKFTVGTIGKNGERIIVSKPQILAKEGESAKITESDTNTGKEHISLSVIAQRKTL